LRVKERLLVSSITLHGETPQCPDWL